ncbi:twin-arginine translocase TatA/TatE family subunit [Acuticoccus sediminis]|uniref:Sec-independent protein translocase protein TatA n=1 Tax=Acuticoccus sediminis TaxID=2184697 RepID=A0A8B2NRE4_9HYPH|nr:twin-arginine translocase TatA/TatE family subunit [Acuticoccus sediminis]RAI00639.1 twin-arginine translocase TatA/TatE family subunit [Acuticoccus sediminis]
MGISIWQVLIIAIVLVLLFGRGKISDLMGDVAKGIKSFKKGMADDDEETRTIDHSPSQTVSSKEQERHNA